MSWNLSLQLNNLYAIVKSLQNNFTLGVGSNLRINISGAATTFGIIDCASLSACTTSGTFIVKNTSNVTIATHATTGLFLGDAVLAGSSVGSNKLVLPSYGSFTFAGITATPPSILSGGGTSLYYRGASHNFQNYDGGEKATINYALATYINPNGTNAVSMEGATAPASLSNYQINNNNTSTPTTYTLPVAISGYTPVGLVFSFNNNSTGSLLLKDNGGTTLYTALAGSIFEVILLSNATSNGTWDIHASLPSNVVWGTAGASIGGNLTLTGTKTLSVGGSISGASVVSSGAISGTTITGTGAISGASVVSTGAISGTTITGTGAISGASVVSTGAISGTTITGTGAISGASVVSTGAISGTTITGTGAISGTTITGTGAISGTSLTATGTTLELGTAGVANVNLNFRSTAPTNFFQFQHQGSGTNAFLYCMSQPANTGVQLTTASPNAWASTSDRRLKENIEDVPNALSSLLQLRTVNFDITSNKNGRKCVGFIAQEIQEIPLFNYLAMGSGRRGEHEADDYLTLAITDFIPYTVKAIQEQHQIIVDLKAELASLKAVVDALVAHKDLLVV